MVTMRVWWVSERGLLSPYLARIEFSLTKFEEPRLKAAEGLDFVFEYIIAINITRYLICMTRIKK